MTRAEIAKETGVSYGTVCNMTRAQHLGFPSTYDYQQHLLHERGFSSAFEYELFLARRKGFSSAQESREQLALDRGFASDFDYRQHLAGVRSTRTSNRKMSATINRRLSELGRNQSWLADQLGVSRQVVSQYAQGKLVPRGANLEKLVRALTSGEALRD